MNDRYHINPPPIVVPELPNEQRIRAIIREEIAVAEGRVRQIITEELAKREEAKK